MAGEIGFRPTAADYVNANRAWFWRALLRRRWPGVLALGSGVVAGIGAAIVWDDPDPTVRWTLVLGMVGGFLLWIATMLVAGYLLVPFHSRRLFRQHRSLDRDFRVRWDDATVIYDGDRAHSEHAWDEYHAWYDGREVVLLLLNDRLFQFLPHRAMTAAQLADLRRCAKAGVVSS